MTSMVNPDPIEFPSYLISEFCKESKASMGTSAIKSISQFASYLDALSSKLRNTLSPEKLQALKNSIESIKQQTGMLRSRMSRQARTLLMNNKERDRIRKTFSSRPETSLRYLVMFMQHRFVTNICNELASNMEALMIRHPPVEIRNIVAALLLVNSGGHRGVVVMRITLEEWEEGWQNREEQTNTMICRVKDHKTVAHSGSAVLVIKSLWLQKALLNYVTHVRPELLRDGDPDSEASKLLFPSRQSSKWVKVWHPQPIYIQTPSCKMNASIRQVFQSITRGFLSQKSHLTALWHISLNSVDCTGITFGGILKNKYLKLMLKHNLNVLSTTILL